MNKVIEQKNASDLILDFHVNCAFVDQDSDSILIDKQGAAELIKVLQEWVDENG